MTIETLNQKIFTGFDLSKSEKALVAYPKNTQDLEENFDFAKENNYQIAIQGGGSSYSDVFFNNQLVIDTKFLNTIKFFDPDNGIIIVEPGIRIGNLLNVIMPKNWTLVGLSGSVNDSLGGMLSSNVHGKDTWKNGNFSQNIVSFIFMFENGLTKEITKENDFELFNSIVGGLGFLGIITEIKMKLKKIPSYMVEQNQHRITNLKMLYDFFYSLDELGCEYVYGVINPFMTGDNIGQGTAHSCRFINGDNCSKVEFNKNLTYSSSIYKLNPKQFWSLSKLFWNNKTNHLQCSFNYLKTFTLNNKIITPFPKYQYPHAAKPNFNFLVAPSGFREFQSVFPKEIAIFAIKELLLLGQHYKIYPMICGIKRHKSESSYLSFACDGLSICWNFSLKGLTTQKREEYCNKIIEIILNHNGKIYLAKNPYFSKNAFRTMYPNYKKVLEAKKKYDPNWLFLSSATRRLLEDK